MNDASRFPLRLMTAYEPHTFLTYASQAKCPRLEDGPVPAGSESSACFSRPPSAQQG